MKNNILKNSIVGFIGVVLIAMCMFGCSNNKNKDNVNIDKVNSNSNEEVNSNDLEVINATKVIIDMAGREVEVPTVINKIYGGDFSASILIYMFDPDKLLGWNFELNETELEYVLPKYHDLPIIAPVKNVNMENLIKLKPEVNIIFGNINDANKEVADNLQKQSGIPTLMVDGDLTKSPEAFEFMGKVLNNEKRGLELVNHSRKILNDISSIKIDDADKISVYYGNGAKSLETASIGAPNVQTLELAKAKNVAVLESESGSRINVSLEQIITWNPQVIIVNGEPTQGLTGDGAKDEILNDPNWKTIDAVIYSRVYGIPKAPFSWVDRPIGPNRLIGVRWLFNILYGDKLNIDINSEIKDFFKVFYHLELEDKDVEKLLFISR